MGSGGQRHDISNEWWDSRIKRFNLLTHPFDSLPCPEAEEGDDDLSDEKIGELTWTAVGDNPGKHWPAIKQVVQRLESMDKLPLYQLHALLVATQESETCKRKMSMTLHAAILLHMV